MLGNSESFCTEKPRFMCRNSAKRRRRKKVAKNQKNFQKSVDKSFWRWYYMQAVSERRAWRSSKTARGPWKLNSVRQERKHTQYPLILTQYEKNPAMRNYCHTDAKERHELQTQNMISTATAVLIPFLRVWSWLRTNAGGVPNTCKSNGELKDRDFGQLIFVLSGGRASNAWVTCLSEGDNSWKRLLIPHNVIEGHPLMTKDLSLKDGLASD